jgi:CPA2 family monovalent cation:H+ antiporter-2
MPGHQADLTGLAIVALAALACGLILARLKQPAIVGYILAGVILGPSALGLVSGREGVEVLAELGVILLLFLVAMEMSLRGFVQVWRVALATTLLQILVSVALMLGLSYAFGWSYGLSILLGFVVALSSTAVVIKMLEQINVLRGPVGQLTVGILIAQDLAVVPMILTLKALAAPAFEPLEIGKIIASIAFLALLTIYLSRRKRVTLPFGRIVAGQFDLRPLAGLTMCFAAAAASGLAGLTPAYGAFLAGLVIGNSNARSMMIQSTRPVQSVLLMVFFLSIGLLIDLKFIWEHIGAVLLLLLLVTVIKTALNIGLLHLLREPWPHAFVAGIMLAQIGEFSFVLGQTGLQTGVIDSAASRLIVAVTALSLLVSPIWMVAARRLMRIILLSVTSFDETLELLLGSRARTVGAQITTAMRRGSFGFARAPAAGAAPARGFTGGLLRRLGLRRARPARPANDPAPVLIHSDPNGNPDAAPAGETGRPVKRRRRKAAGSGA